MHTLSRVELISKKYGFSVKDVNDFEKRCFDAGISKIHWDMITQLDLTGLPYIDSNGDRQVALPKI